MQIIMQKTVFIIIIILIVVIGGYFLLKGGKTSTITAPTPAPGVAPEEVEERVVLPEEAGPVKEFTVIGTEYSFSPSTISVEAGERVKINFRNEGRIVHNLIFRDSGIGTRSIGGGESETIEFTAPASGIYSFLCTISGHAVAGMVGDLEVE